jgi:pimeloyl-ACP methyl ester carboxylesterase
MTTADGRIDIPVTGGMLAAWHRGAPTDNSAPVVLAAHGITGNHVSWAPVQRLLGDQYAFIATDLRGRGRSNEISGPFGMAAHSDDQLAVLDHLGIDRAVIVGHSMGAHVMARFTADHPDRVRGLVLVDGGLSRPVPENVDVQAMLEAVLGPALARLSQSFSSRHEYHEFWRKHPAFGNGDVEDADLVAYADHDLIGEPPSMRSSVRADAVADDGGDMFTAGDPAQRLTVDTVLLRAPRGLFDEPTPLIAEDLAAEWAAQRPAQRKVIETADVNHYTIVMGKGAGSVARAISGYGAHP